MRHLNDLFLYRGGWNGVRSREDIEKDVSACDYPNRLVIELLLDIRDLLSNVKDLKERQLQKEGVK